MDFLICHWPKWCHLPCMIQSGWGEWDHHDGLDQSWLIPWDWRWASFLWNTWSHREDLNKSGIPLGRRRWENGCWISHHPTLPHSLCWWKKLLPIIPPTSIHLYNKVFGFCHLQKPSQLWSSEDGFPLYYPEIRILILFTIYVLGLCGLISNFKQNQIKCGQIRRQILNNK